MTHGDMANSMVLDRWAPFALLFLAFLVSCPAPSHAIYCPSEAGPSVDCSSADAAYCIENQFTEKDACLSAGFTQLQSDDEEQRTYGCAGGGGGCGAAAVPELEDYAAAAFLVLALTIGWQVRRRQQMI